MSRAEDKLKQILAEIAAWVEQAEAEVAVIRAQAEMTGASAGCEREGCGDE